MSPPDVNLPSSTDLHSSSGDDDTIKRDNLLSERSLTGKIIDNRKGSTASASICAVAYPQLGQVTSLCRDTGTCDPQAASLAIKGAQPEGALRPRLVSCKEGVSKRQTSEAISVMSSASLWQGHTPLPCGEAFPGCRRQSAVSIQSINGSASSGKDHSDQAVQVTSSTQNSNIETVSSDPSFFKSHLLARGTTIHKPWTEQKSRQLADRKASWIFLVCGVAGFLGAVVVVLFAYLEAPRYTFCLVLEDQFSGSSLNPDTWLQEQQTGGFVTGEFEWVTNSRNNSYVQNGSLYIVPTLTSDFTGVDAITDGYTLNLTSDGTCTSANKSDVYCAVRSNLTQGIILPPVQSARLVTNVSTSIRFGRVEVRAKLPTGDWIWPAIWMMPKSSVYGDWPKSGEIDIAQSKGNRVTSHSTDGSNTMHSGLHWGLDTNTDRHYLTSNERRLYRKYYNEDFHTFGLDWTPKGIKMWEGSPVHTSFSYDFGKGFWHAGAFPGLSANGSLYADPWPAGNIAAPFDQEFFLLLSVSIGSTNGFFSEPSKPWSDDAPDAVNQFWEAKDSWYKSWPTMPEDRAMIVDWVKMYNLTEERVGCS